MHSSGSSQVPPTAPYPGRPGRWHCRSSHSDSPLAVSAATRRSSTEDEHTITGISKQNQKTQSACRVAPSERRLCPRMITLEETLWESLIRKPHRILAVIIQLMFQSSIIYWEMTGSSLRAWISPSSSGFFHSALHSCQPIEVSDKRVKAKSHTVKQSLGQNQRLAILSFRNCHVPGFCIFLCFMLEASFQVFELELEDSNNLSHFLWIIIPKPFNWHSLLITLQWPAVV